MNQKQPLQNIRLQQQNRRLQKVVDQYMQEIQHQKHINTQHEKQIQSLLKFNQRLLSIIEDEVNNNQAAIMEKSLQPISEVTQNDSENMQLMMQSLQKTRRKLAARSQKGGASYLPTHDRASTTTDNNKVYQYMNEVKDLERSERYVGTERDHSEFGNKSSFSKKRDKKGIVQKMDFRMKNQLEMDTELQRVATETKPLNVEDISACSFIDEKRKEDSQYNKIEQKIATTISQEIQQLRKNKEINCSMLDDKINRLNKLSKEMTFNPEQKFVELQSKVKLSPQIAAMVKKAMVKK